MNIPKIIVFPDPTPFSLAPIALNGHVVKAH